MEESTTESEMSSYRFEKSYGGGLDTAGEGELNWRGRPKCGARSGRSGAGILCYGEPDSGSHGAQFFGVGDLLKGCYWESRFPLWLKPSMRVIQIGSLSGVPLSYGCRHK
jgi:hypothetical protein